MNESNLDTLNYSEFWSRNLQEIEDIKQSLILSINKLEKKQPEFEPLFDEVMNKIYTLSSIYSSFNNIKGGEYVLKLKSLMEEYKKKFTNDGVNFELISYIIQKISSITEESIEKLPFLQQTIESDCADKNINFFSGKERNHKWITFEKNGFWFILKYNEINIIKNNSLITEKKIGGGSLEVSFGNEKYICRNLFPVLVSEESRNNFYIITDNGKNNYSATRTGKRIYASNDFISSKIKSFKNISGSKISPGRVKLFGKNHIVLN